MYHYRKSEAPGRPPKERKAALRMTMTTAFITTFMGSALTSQFYGDEAAVSAISAVNLPDSVRAMAEPAGIAFDEIDASEIETRQDAIAAQADFPDALAIFPADFDEAVAA